MTLASQFPHPLTNKFDGWNGYYADLNLIFNLDFFQSRSSRQISRRQKSPELLQPLRTGRFVALGWHSKSLWRGSEEWEDVEGF